jgi:hypothetical protein
VQAVLLQASSRVDGRAFCAAALEEVRARVARGERCLAVFDIDNTLVDTRPRTVAAARAFGKRYGVKRLAEATLADVGVDGRSTCLRMGLGPGALTDAFHAFWLEEFWKPESFARDLPIPEVVALARAAADAGAEVCCVTGRIATLAETTRKELGRLEASGLPPVPAERLVCKPSLDVRTTEAKDAWLRERRAEGAHIAFFITEGERDINQLKQRQPELPCVLVEFPVGNDASRVPADTPCFPLGS